MVAVPRVSPWAPLGAVAATLAGWAAAKVAGPWAGALGLSVCVGLLAWGRATATKVGTVLGAALGVWLLPTLAGPSELVWPLAAVAFVALVAERAWQRHPEAATWMGWGGLIGAGVVWAFTTAWQTREPRATQPSSWQHLPIEASIEPCASSCPRRETTPGGHQVCSAEVVSSSALSLSRRCGAGLDEIEVSARTGAHTTLWARPDASVEVHRDAATGTFVVSQGGQALRAVDRRGAQLIELGAKHFALVSAPASSALWLSGLSWLLLPLAGRERWWRARLANASSGVIRAGRFFPDDADRCPVPAPGRADGPALAFGQAQRLGYREGAARRALELSRGTLRQLEAVSLMREGRALALAVLGLAGAVACALLA